MTQDEYHDLQAAYHRARHAREAAREPASPVRVYWTARRGFVLGFAFGFALGFWLAAVLLP